MIIVDYSNVASASLFKGLAMNSLDVVGRNPQKFLLGKIRNYNKDFRKEFGELVLCADSYSWRLKYWPLYKARRRALRSKEMEANPDDIRHQLYQKIHEFWDLMVKHSPYKCIKIKGAEGDDIISVLARTPGKHVVISKDKDISQLTRFENVKAFDPIKKKFVNNGKNFWHHLVVSGDPGDDIPNILSDDDTFIVPGKRQRQLRSDVRSRIVDSSDPIEEILGMKFNGISSEDVVRNYKRNLKLIDLTRVPEGLRSLVLKESKNKKTGYNLMELVTAFQCPEYITRLEDFVPRYREDFPLELH